MPLFITVGNTDKYLDDKKKEKSFRNSLKLNARNKCPSESYYRHYEDEEKENRKKAQINSRNRSEEKLETKENEKENHEKKKNLAVKNEMGSGIVVWESEKSENDDVYSNNRYVWTKKIKSEKMENEEKRIKTCDIDGNRMDDCKNRNEIREREMKIENKVKDSENKNKECDKEIDGDNRRNIKDNHNDEVIRAVTLNLQRITLREKENR